MTVRSAALFLLFGLLFLLTGAAAPAQDEGASAEPGIDDMCKELSNLFKGKKDFDAEGVLALFKLLDGKYKDATPAEKTLMAKTVKKAFDLSPMAPDEVWKAAVGLCVGMGKHGKDVLFSALDHKNLKVKNKDDQGEVRRKKDLTLFVIEGIGLNQEPSSVKELCDRLWDDDWEIVKATAGALGRYNKLALKERKPIVQELVKRYANVYSISAQNPKRDDFRQMWQQLEVPFNEALRSLTNQNIESAVEWEKWYNDNKNKPEW